MSWAPRPLLSPEPGSHLEPGPVTISVVGAGQTSADRVRLLAGTRLGLADLGSTGELSGYPASIALTLPASADILWLQLLWREGGLWRAADLAYLPSTGRLWSAALIAYEAFVAGWGVRSKVVWDGTSGDDAKPPVAVSVSGVTATFAAATGLVSFASSARLSGLVRGDVVVISGSDSNDGRYRVLEVVSATSLRIAAPATLVDETAVDVSLSSVTEWVDVSWQPAFGAWAWTADAPGFTVDGYLVLRCYAPAGRGERLRWSLVDDVEAIVRGRDDGALRWGGNVRYGPPTTVGSSSVVTVSIPWRWEPGG